MHIIAVLSVCALPAIDVRLPAGIMNRSLARITLPGDGGINISSSEHPSARLLHSAAAVLGESSAFHS